MSNCPCRGLLQNCPLCGGGGKLSSCICGGLRVVARQVGEMRWEWKSCPRCGEDEAPALEYSSGLSEGMERWTFGSLYQDYPALTSIAAGLEQWLASGRGWRVFAAPWGRGKTYLMAALVNKARASGQEAVYWLTSSMLQELQDAALERSAWSFGTLFRVLSTVPLLCLDEFGHVGLTARREEWLRAMLVSRSDPVWLPTVFATNDPVEKFKMEMPWLGSRWGGSEVVLIRFDGIPDLRRERRKRVVL
jgi:hypothetical protein